MSRLDLDLTTPPGAVVPGGMTRTTLSLRNTGTEVERYTLRPSGSLAEWTTLEADELRLFPGEQTSVEVRVAVPCAPLPPAGAASIGVDLVDSDGDRASVERPVTVAPCPTLHIQAPVPGALWTARRALVHADLANIGNVEVPTRLVVRDREGRVTWPDHADGWAFTLAAGDRSRVPLALTLGRTTWVGKDAPREYTVSAMVLPAGGTEAVETSATAVITQVPVVRRWWLAVLLLLVVAAMPDTKPQWLIAFAAFAAFVAVLVLAVYRFVRVVRAGGGRDRPGRQGRDAR